MEDKDKKRDPMPPPDATPEEIGEFWDTHSLADYWDETHEVEFQVNLKSGQDLLPSEDAATDQNNPLSAEQGWGKLKELIQRMDKWHTGKKKGDAFEELVVTLLRLSLNLPFVRAKTGSQPSGDARSLTGEISVQAKNYSDGSTPSDTEIEGDIRRAYRTLQDLDVYILAISRDAAQSYDTLDAIVEDTGLDIVALELTDKLSDLGALCATFWKDISHFFNPSDIDQEFSDWIQIASADLKTKEQLKQVYLKLKEGIQTRHQVYQDAKEYLRRRFASGTNHISRFKYPIDLSKAMDRASLESHLTNWWKTPGNPVCYLEGEGGIGKSWLAAKWVKSICEDKEIVSFWLDSDTWKDCESLDDLFETCLKTIPGYHNEKKIAKLKYKIRDFWWPPTLIVLDGVNEQDTIESIRQILDEYFTHGNELEGKIRIRLLLTTRSLHANLNWQYNMWNGCKKIPVSSFNEVEFSQALNREGLSLSNIHNSLSDLDLIRIPRYFQIWVRLSKQFQSSSIVTKEMVLWEDLLDKIKYTDSQIQKRLGWQNVEDAQDILAKLAQEAEWINIDDTPQTSVEQFKRLFPNYFDIRGDLEELHIALKAGKIEVELSQDRIVLGWALYLSKLLDCQEFTEIRNLPERFQQELEPIPSEDRRADALYIALHITSIHSEDSHNHLSQKRAALMYTWLHSSNAQFTNDQVSYWIKKDTAAYAQFVELEFEHHNLPNYEDMLITPLAKAWLNKDGNINHLASLLGKWIFPANTDIDYTESEEDSFPTMYYTRNRLLAAAISILSQRPEHQFLETLARCYENSAGKAQFRDDIGRLMRWAYTEDVLDELHSLVEQTQDDELLLRGVYGLAECLKKEHLPQLLQRSLSGAEQRTHALIKERNRRFKLPIDRIRNQERLLIGDSPAANGNYHELDYLAVRIDLPDWHHEDIVEIKKILQDVSLHAKLGRSAGATLEDFCIENLLPWVAKYDSESYAELACALKLNTLNQEWAQFKLWSIQGLIFKPEDRKRVTTAILGMRQRLSQGKDFYQDVEYLTSLLTETLLFSASEDRLTDWFEFLASHEPLRISICYEPLPYLLKELLPKSIVKLARQKLEELRSSVSDNQTLSNGEPQEFSEEEFWWTLYADGPSVDENSVQFALDELKLRKPDSTGTYPMLRLALSNSKQFLDEMRIDKRIQEHLFSKNGRRFIVHPYKKGKTIPSYDKLRVLLPQEIMGSFLCSPDRHADLMRWGRELMVRMCSILQGAEGDSNSIKERQFEMNREVLRIWAELDTTDFLQLANEYLTELSKSPWYSQALSHFTDAIRCLLLRFQPDKAKRYYHQWNAESFKTVYRTRYGVPTLLAQLWKVEQCDSPEHRQFRRELLEECLNDEDIMFVTLAALAEGGRDELWSLVTQEYIKSSYAKERNLGVSILPWFGTDEAIEKLDQLKSEDSSRWVREHAAWAYEVAQQEYSCREVYRKALQTCDLFRISAVFEQMKPALSPTAQWWHREVENTEFGEEPQDLDSKLAALIDRFWNRWGNSTQTKRNIEIFGRKLREYCRGEKLSAGSTPRIAPWWKPTSDSDNW